MKKNVADQILEMLGKISEQLDQIENNTKDAEQTIEWEKLKLNREYGREAPSTTLRLGDYGASLGRCFNGILYQCMGNPSHGGSHTFLCDSAPLADRMRDTPQPERCENAITCVVPTGFLDGAVGTSSVNERCVRPRGHLGCCKVYCVKRKRLIEIVPDYTTPNP